MRILLLPDLELDWQLKWASFCQLLEHSPRQQKDGAEERRHEQKDGETDTHAQEQWSRRMEIPFMRSLPQEISNIIALHKHKLSHFFEREGARYQQSCFDGKYICRTCPGHMDCENKHGLKYHLWLDDRHESEVELRSRGYERSIILKKYNNRVFNKTKNELLWIEHRRQKQINKSKGKLPPSPQYRCSSFL